jgi:hypothetical protein
VIFTHYPGLNFCESDSKLLLDSDPDFFKPETEKNKSQKACLLVFLDLPKGFQTSGQATSTPE